MISTPYRIILRLKHLVTFLGIVFLVFFLLIICTLEDNGRRSTKKTVVINPTDLQALQEKYSRTHKLLCYVLLSSRKVGPAKQIKESWGKKCDKLVFFGRFINPDIPITFLDASEGYAYLWGKTHKALIYLEENFKDYDWFFKADDDTFAVVENLRNFLRQYDPDEAIWSGYKLKHPRLPTGYMSGGAGYVFSRSALENVTKLFRRIQDGERAFNQTCKTGSIRGIEDLELGQCLKDAGVGDVSSLDSEGRERFLPLPIDTLWEGKVPIYHWLWRQAWNPLKLGRECCSPHVISTHQISPDRMKRMYTLLYKKHEPAEDNSLHDQ